jgi:RNA polymerase sigma-70 factor (ECF subfamily)
MTAREAHEITELLAAWQEGRPNALDRAFDLVYPELRRMAHRDLAKRPEDTLDSAALVNEAYLRLVHSGGIPCENRVHFLALCAQIMRRIVVDHARRRRQAKRGGTAAVVPLEDVLLAVEASGIDVLALNEALDALAEIDNRKSRVVELRYFGGLTMEEVAAVLEVSVDTAKRDWRLARAWLMTRLSPTSRADPTG